MCIVLKFVAVAYIMFSSYTFFNMQKLRLLYSCLLCVPAISIRSKKIHNIVNLSNQGFIVNKGSMTTFDSKFYVNDLMSKRIDEVLMTQPGFSLDQLMELAGYSVASATLSFISSSYSYHSGETGPTALVICGPGNNGGDGLVAARHLKHFGFFPSILYPKPGKGSIFGNLLKQATDLEIPILQTAPNSTELNNFNVVIDAIFGFSFKGPATEPFASIINLLAASAVPVVSVDVPSGWNVNDGDTYNTGFKPHAVISLTVPKQCMRGYDGIHYVGGR